MTAPSLILVGYGSRDPRVAQVSHDIRAGVLAIRPELDVHIAFVGEGQPNGLQVAAKLAKRGRRGSGAGAVAAVRRVPRARGVPGAGRPDRGHHRRDSR